MADRHLKAGITMHGIVSARMHTMHFSPTKWVAGLRERLFGLFAKPTKVCFMSTFTYTLNALPAIRIKLLVYWLIVISSKRRNEAPREEMIGLCYRCLLLH